MTQELRACGVSVRFGATTAVSGVDLIVAPGELVAVTGPSGAGKSSLLGALAGLYRLAAGSVSVGHTAVSGRDDASGRGVVLIPQGNALVRILTAFENVAVPLVARGRDDAFDAAAAALAAVGLGDSTGQLVEELSGGQQQRLAIARGLAEGGSVVLADEPTSELDAANRALVMRLMRAESDRGAAVVVATHDAEAAAVCDAELRLDEGVPGWPRDDRTRRLPAAQVWVKEP